MNDLIQTLRETKTNDALRQQSPKELEELIRLFGDLSKTAQTILEKQILETEDDSDEEFIEIQIDGKPDLIKKSIKVLNISCNDFKTLPAAIYKLKHLQKLYLFSNKFSVEEKKKIRRTFPARVQIYF